jgi:hypothetical protein
MSWCEPAYSLAKTAAPPIQTLRQNILYFAEEREGKPAHPLADSFFITKQQQQQQQQLVLVDVAGGDVRKVLQKRKTLMAAWIAEDDDVSMVLLLCMRWSWPLMMSADNSLLV